MWVERKKDSHNYKITFQLSIFKVFLNVYINFHGYIIQYFYKIILKNRKHSCQLNDSSIKTVKRKYQAVCQAHLSKWQEIYLSFIIPVQKHTVQDNEQQPMIIGYDLRNNRSLEKIPRRKCFHLTLSLLFNKSQHPSTLSK